MGQSSIVPVRPFVRAAVRLADADLVTKAVGDEFLCFDEPADFLFGALPTLGNLGDSVEGSLVAGRAVIFGHHRGARPYMRAPAGFLVFCWRPRLPEPPAWRADALRRGLIHSDPDRREAGRWRLFDRASSGSLVALGA